MSIKITADSPADLPEGMCEKYDIKIIPLHIILGDTCYEDGITVTPDGIYDYYSKTKELPKTASVSIAEYMSFFEEASKNGDEVLHFSLSSGISSTYHNAVLASEDMPNVHIIDTKSLTAGIALLVMKAVEMIGSGMDAASIAEKCRQLVDKIDTTFIISNLEFLYKGGRCSGIAVLGANVLGIKPSIAMDSEGKLQVDKKYRGKFSSCISQYIDDLLKQNKGNIDTDRAVVVRTAGITDEQVQAAVKKIKDAVDFKEIIVTTAGCTITSHCGKGTFTFMYMTK